jgi:hypothetical protein
MHAYSFLSLLETMTHLHNGTTLPTQTHVDLVMQQKCSFVQL